MILHSILIHEGSNKWSRKEDFHLLPLLKPYPDEKIGTGYEPLDYLWDFYCFVGIGECFAFQTALHT